MHNHSLDTIVNFTSFDRTSQRTSMNKLVVLVVATVALFCCGQAEGYNRKKCMMTMGKMNFDQEKFSGDWYVVAEAISSEMPRTPSTCKKMEYSAKEDGNTTHINLRCTLTTPEGPVVFISKGQPMFSKMGSLSQAVWKRETDDKWMAVYTQSILATDYDQFAILYACHPVYNEKEDMFDKFELVEVLSRKPEMESTLLGVLKNLLTGFDYAKEEITMSDNSAC